MGVIAKINGKPTELRNYRVTESSTPLAGGDTSGAVGVIDATFDAGRFAQPFLLSEKPIELIDTARGSTLGTIRNIDDIRGSKSVRVTADTRLGLFNIEVQTQPYSGTLEGAFNYYASLANIDSLFYVEPSLRNRSVHFPGWEGNLWTHMKMLAAGVRADLNLVSNYLVLRPVRSFTARQNRELDSTVTLDAKQLALKQEVVWYETKLVERGLVYPAGGWTTDVTPLSVPAGETIETTLDTGGSVYEVEQPVCVASVDRHHGLGSTDTSVYTVVGDDNIVIQPAQWQAYGGSLSVAISEDSRSLVVTLVGASGIYQINGTPMKTFRIALSAGTSDSTYSTLRVMGRYVSMTERSLVLPTGVEEWRTGQEFAPTIENPFLNNINDAYTAGTRGARRAAGRTFSYSGTITALNPRGVQGSANYPLYSDVQTAWDALTYGGVKAAQAPKTYATVRTERIAAVQPPWAAQVFGNAPGARLYDRPSKRWFRIRDATIEWQQIGVQADDDLLFGDLQQHLSGKTYGAVKALYGSVSYYEANLMGIPG